VKIDGPQPSSSSGPADGEETLTGGWWGLQLTWGLSPATRSRRGGAADDGDSRDGRVDRNGRRAADLHDGRGELLVGLAGTSSPASLGQEEG
jgi:hypothetical protein